MNLAVNPLILNRLNLDSTHSENIHSVTAGLGLGNNALHDSLAGRAKERGPEVRILSRETVG